MLASWFVGVFGNLFCLSSLLHILLLKHSNEFFSVHVGHASNCLNRQKNPLALTSQGCMVDAPFVVYNQVHYQQYLCGLLSQNKHQFLHKAMLLQRIQGSNMFCWLMLVSTMKLPSHEICVHEQAICCWLLINTCLII